MLKNISRYKNTNAKQYFCVVFNLTLTVFKMQPSIDILRSPPLDNQTNPYIISSLKHTFILIIFYSLVCIDFVCTVFLAILL